MLDGTTSTPPNPASRLLMDGMEWDEKNTLLALIRLLTLLTLFKLLTLLTLLSLLRRSKVRSVLEWTGLDIDTLRLL